MEGTGVSFTDKEAERNDWIGLTRSGWDRAKQKPKVALETSVQVQWLLGLFRVEEGPSDGRRKLWSSWWAGNRSHSLKMSLRDSYQIRKVRKGKETLSNRKSNWSESKEEKEDITWHGCPISLRCDNIASVKIVDWIGYWIKWGGLQLETGSFEMRMLTCGPRSPECWPWIWSFLDHLLRFLKSGVGILCEYL